MGRVQRPTTPTPFCPFADGTPGPEVATLVQGRFKRDGSAPAEQEPRGGTDRGSSPQHAQNPGPAAAGDNGDRAQRPASTTSSGAEPGTPPASRGPVDTGSRIALRNWRISTRLVSLLALPVVAATSLGGLRINESMTDMQQLEHMQLLTQMTKQATSLAQALQVERDQSAGPLSNGSKATDYKVSQPREKTDRAKDSFLDATNEIGDFENDDALESIHASVAQIASQLGDIRSIRKSAYEDGAPSLNTIDQYSQLITSLLSLSQDMAQATSNPDMIKRTRALAAFSSAKEYASIQRAVIAAALPGGSVKEPHLNENDKQFGSNALDKETRAISSFKSIYGSTGESAVDLMAPLDNGNNPEINAANMYAKHILDTPNGIDGAKVRSYMDWYDQSSTKIDAMKTIETTLLSDMEAKARELREASQREAIINGAVILLVLGVSLVGAFVVARSMIRSLRRLQDTATRVAQDRLPEPRQAALRDRPAGRRHLRRVGRCALPGRDRPGGRGLRRRAPRGRPPRRRAGPSARQRQRDVHQPLAAFAGPHPASALAHLRAGVARGRPGPALLALQARPPRDPYAP